MNNLSTKDLYEGKNWIKASNKIWNPRFNGKIVLILLDLFTYVTSITIAYLIRLPNQSIEGVLFSSSHLPIILILFTSFEIFEAYNTKDVLGKYSLTAKTLLSSVFIVPGIFLFDYIFGVYNYSHISGRGITFLFGSFFILISSIHRYIFSNFFIQKSSVKTWGFIGTKKEFDIFISNSKKSFYSQYFNFLFLDKSSILEKKDYALDGIVISPRQDLEESTLFNHILRYRMNSGEVLSTYQFCENYWLRIPLEIIDINTLCLAPGFNLKTIGFFFHTKRILDFFLSIVFIILSSPIILLAAIVIKATDGGPIFYSQIRTGLKGKHFKIFKLRSMRVDAEKGGAQWSSKLDSRITWIGKIIRRTRIDEIPQFINVIKGDMSIIGPRPERPEIEKELTEKVPFYPLRHQMKPGITGWAQVLYPYGSSIEDTVNKLEHELYYIKNHSLFLDLVIYLKTIKTVIFFLGR